VAGGPLADPVAETRRLIALAGQQRLLLRALGGVGILLQAPDAQPRLPRRARDIDLAAAQGTHKAATALLGQAGYHGEEMFNALRGSRRLLFHDLTNRRHLDVFVGEFAMCHTIPLTDRLDRDPLTVPREELLLTKLQIVELTGNDQGDIYNLLFHHDVGDGAGAPIDTAFIAVLCARDWGLWRTCQLNIERSRANLPGSGLAPDEQQTVASRLEFLRGRIDAEPKTMKWRLRSRAGDRVRWYDEPEEEDPAGQ
jgi:hypothetical protein